MNGSLVAPFKPKPAQDGHVQGTPGIGTGIIARIEQAELQVWGMTFAITLDDPRSLRPTQFGFTLDTQPSHDPTICFVQLSILALCLFDGAIPPIHPANGGIVTLDIKLAVEPTGRRV